jgi:cystathionine beta-lyase
MKYNFDIIIDRKNTDCEKWDFMKEFNKPADVLPMWVADMDFVVLPEIQDAIIKRAQHPVYGYSDPSDDYFSAVQKWFRERFDFELDKSWIVKTPGVIAAFCAAIKALTKPGESVLISQPVYYPFARSIELNDRVLVNNPLIFKDGQYAMDFDDFEKKIVDHNVKMFLFCSPHNPVGRVWTEQELKQIGRICAKHNVFIFSDEIHCDFVFKGYKHLPIANVCKDYRDNILTATAPSKTFNLAGLKTSNIFIPSHALRSLFLKQVQAAGVNMIGPFGIEACKAAYNFGGPWVDELKAYLQKNLDYIEAFLAKKAPQVKLIKPQGTYLIWLDMRSLKMTRKELDDMLSNKAKIWIDEGEIFGPGGEGFIRINIATPLSTIKKAFDNLAEAVRGIV